MLDLQHGTINPLLVTPQQLQEQITLIQKTLRPNLRIPISRTIGDLSLYKTFSVHTQMTKSFVIFQLKLPLINSEEFQLFNLLPVPIQRVQRSYLIQTSTRYLLVNLQRSQYYPISQDELDKCTTTADNIFLCVQHHPLYNKQSSINQCELALLNHQEPSSMQCVWAPINNTNFWIQAHQENTWIYTLGGTRIFDTICGTEVITQTLQGSGVL
ncbi:uncharacterized protein LOC119661084 [Hermetia illucens]|uniref:uncharacterized protein LOC119661084 n=1 Tax=Hermetia illucens TaxID=343691 RepID=UPI0018CC4C24|nr:uncharacterized protein LOC119661084 [Hermetia illucens]